MRQGSAEDVAQDIGVSRETLYNWKNQLLGREAPASMKRQHDSPPDPARQELERQLDELRRDIRRLQLKQDILKKANEIVKKDVGIDRQRLSNREKTLLVDALSTTWESFSKKSAWRAVPTSTIEPGSMSRTDTSKCAAVSTRSSRATTVVMATAGCVHR
jgi:transposase-like protein